MSVGQDILHSLRRLAKAPFFTGVATLSLAMAIGACTASFSLVNAILLRALPVPNPQELRLIQWSGTEVTPYYRGKNRVTILAAWVPARQAARIDPAVALRNP